MSDTALGQCEVGNRCKPGRGSYRIEVHRYADELAHPGEEISSQQIKEIVLHGLPSDLDLVKFEHDQNASFGLEWIEHTITHVCVIRHVRHGSVTEGLSTMQWQWQWQRLTGEPTCGAINTKSLHIVRENASRGPATARTASPKLSDPIGERSGACDTTPESRATASLIAEEQGTQAGAKEPATRRRRDGVRWQCDIFYRGQWWGTLVIRWHLCGYPRHAVTATAEPRDWLRC